MKITVDRRVSSNNATLSLVSIDGVEECYGIEDERRDVKVQGETRIPSGVYRVGLRLVGGFNSRYADKFDDFHEGMLHVLDVPGFEYILIHIGNYETNTEGCLCIGSTPMLDNKLNLSVGSSEAAYRKFYPKVIKAAKENNLTIEYIDNDYVT